MSKLTRFAEVRSWRAFAVEEVEPVRAVCEARCQEL
jgi:hypothetical protein